MKLGDSGLPIRQLQGDLTSLGYLCTRDGDYGPNTCKMVKSFQAAHGLMVDGEAGPATLTAIAKAKGARTTAAAKCFGIDVSAWQPNTNWELVKKSGAQFAFIKASEGATYVSPTFKADYVAAKTVGLIVGTYHFFKAKTLGLDQAEHYLDTIKGYHSADDLPLVLDLEETSIPKAELLLQATAFLDELEKQMGRKPILYTNPATVTYIGAPDELKNYPLWIAAPERASAPLVAPWDQAWKFWQYTFKGHYQGTTGQDGNYFNGSLNDLKAFVGAPTVQPNPDVPLAVTPVADEHLEAPWMAWLESHEGLTEAKNSRQIADLVWPHTNYTAGQKAHTVVGPAYAWCAATSNAALENAGYKGNRSAAAISFQTFGEACEIKYGAILPLQHKSGGHHVTFFHHWVDEQKKLAACLGGNQSDALKISTYNLSGNGLGADQVVPSPRWPVVKL